MRQEDVRLYREHKWTNDGRKLIDTELPTDVIPLVASPHNAAPTGDLASIVGVVSNVRRGRRGWVLGDLETRGSDPFNFTALHCESDFDNGSWDSPKKQGTVLRGARLRAVHVGISPCWKGMQIR